MKQTEHVQRVNKSGLKASTSHRWKMFSDSDSDIKWSRPEGRQVVDLKQLAKDLHNCKRYSNQLNLLDTVKE